MLTTEIPGALSWFLKGVTETSLKHIKLFPRYCLDGMNFKNVSKN